MGAHRAFSFGRVSGIAGVASSELPQVFLRERLVEKNRDHELPLLAGTEPADCGRIGALLSASSARLGICRHQERTGTLAFNDPPAGTSIQRNRF